jgi:hypothetical protein
MNAIKNLELLPGMLAYDKANILLVYGGLKPSAQTVMQGESFRSSGDVVLIEPRYITMLESILSELKLSYVYSREVTDARSNNTFSMSQEVMKIYVAPNKRAASRLKAVFSNIQKNHLSAGILLGYPETAVKAFLTPDMLDWEDHPVSTEEVSELNMRLLGHRLSRSNWHEEVKYLESSGDYLKKVSPKIYKEVTKK